MHELPGEKAAVSIGAGVRPARAHGDPGTADRDAAFDAEHEWNGVALFPFSIDRESLFAQQRLAMGAPPIMTVVNDFDGFLADAMRILFVCSHKAEDFRPLRRDALVFQEAIEDWANRNIPRAKRGEAIVLAMNIYADSVATAHEPVPSGNKTDDLGN